MTAKSSLPAARLCLLMIIVVLFGALACDLPVSLSPAAPTALPTARPRVPTSTSAPTQPPPPPASPASTTRAPSPTATNNAPMVSEVTIYLVALEDGGKGGKAVGCGDSLLPVKHQITPARPSIALALNELFEIKEQFIGQSGLYNALYQSDLRVESAEVDANGIATVSLTGQVRMGGVCDIPRFKGQIDETIRAVNGVQAANILLNGKTIDEALSQK